MNYDFKKHISSKIFKVIAYASNELGYKTYVIGGYVRDILLRRPSNDIDVVTVGKMRSTVSWMFRQTGPPCSISCIFSPRACSIWGEFPFACAHPRRTFPSSTP